jgi:hypothetical protein
MLDSLYFLKPAISIIQHYYIYIFNNITNNNMMMFIINLYIKIFIFNILLLIYFNY